MVQPNRDQQPYRHIGHVMDDDGDLTEVVVPFLRTALAAGEPVVIACPDPVATTLATALDSRGGVQLAPADPLDQRPPNALAAISGLVDRDLPGDGRRLHLVTCPGRQDADWSVWTQTEALLNHVLAARPVDHLCLMKTADVDDGPDAATVARATHPWLLTADGVVENPDYRPPAELLREVQRAQEPDPLEDTEPTLSLIDLDDMRILRRALTRQLVDSPLSPDAAPHFGLASDE